MWFIIVKMVIFHGLKLTKINKMQVLVTGRNLELGIKSFRKKTQKEGIIKEARLRKAYEKPSEKKKRKAEEAISRKKKKRAEFSGQ